MVKLSRLVSHGVAPTPKLEVGSGEPLGRESVGSRNRSVGHRALRVGSRWGRSPFARQTVVYRPQIEVAESITCSRTSLGPETQGLHGVSKLMVSMGSQNSGSPWGLKTQVLHGVPKLRVSMGFQNLGSPWGLKTEGLHFRYADAARSPRVQHKNIRLKILRLKIRVKSLRLKLLCFSGNSWTDPW